jgi:ferritin-like metal-binding protein YciE
VHAKIREHFAATEQHRERMADQLKAYNKSPSGLKSALSALTGMTQGSVQGIRPESLATMARNSYATEHFDIGMYTILITTARAFGDENTVRACELNLRDEVDMQAWLAQHLPEATLLTYEKDGITIPQAAWDLARSAQTMGVPSMFTTMDTLGIPSRQYNGEAVRWARPPA